MWARRQHRLQDQRPFLVLCGSLIALAWLSLFLWGKSPYSRFLVHDTLGEVSPILLPIFVLAWTVMIAAMMLPTSLPLIATFCRLVEAKP